MADDLASAIRASSQRLGLDPVDLATVISYETAGTFDPWKAGPTTQWGQHRGLIQWGEPQRAKYGVYQGQPVGDQLRAVEQYLGDAGFKPGMGIMDLYSAINAGRVGRYGASDANNGGAPGTVADKVNNQMSGHRAKAAALLGGSLAAPAPTGQPTAQQPRTIADIFGGQAPEVGNPTALQQGGLGTAALMFAQNQVLRRQQRADEQAAEEERRRALLAPDGLAGLYG